MHLQSESLMARMKPIMDIVLSFNICGNSQNKTIFIVYVLYLNIYIIMILLEYNKSKGGRFQ